MGQLTNDEQRTYSIGELAEEFGMTPRALRLYEEEGLIFPDRIGERRIYSHRDRARVAMIGRGKRMGFSLAEIRSFLELYDADPSHIEQARFALVRARSRAAQLEEHLHDIVLTLKELRAMEREATEHLVRHGLPVPDESENE